MKNGIGYKRCLDCRSTAPNRSQICPGCGNKFPSLTKAIRKIVETRLKESPCGLKYLVGAVQDYRDVGVAARIEKVVDGLIAEGTVSKEGAGAKTLYSRA